MAARHTINAEKRDVFGKQINKFRKEGKVPGNIYGKVTDPTAVWFNEKDLENLLKEVSETALIDIIINGEKARPAVLRDVQHAVARKGIIHVDAQQVNLREKIQVAVPVEVTGESESVTKGTAIMETLTSEVEVEALPTDLPEAFTVDITSLAEPGDKIIVADLKVPQGVEILTEPETTLVALIEPQSQEEEEETAAAPDEAAQVDNVETTVEGATEEEEKSE